jgi:uncharacterized membrane protein YedE/YeeE
VKSFLLAALAGALFAVGLCIGGMTVPARIIGFLDVGRGWDPSLAFVMAGALAVYALLLRVIQRRPAPLRSPRFYGPTAHGLDARLVGGAALFGIGWGLSGYCPGPALVSLAGGGGASALIFVAAMIGGVGLARLVSSRAAS